MQASFFYDKRPDWRTLIFALQNSPEMFVVIFTFATAHQALLSAVDLVQALAGGFAIFRFALQRISHAVLDVYGELPIAVNFPLYIFRIGSAFPLRNYPNGRWPTISRLNWMHFLQVVLHLCDHNSTIRALLKIAI